MNGELKNISIRAIASTVPEHILDNEAFAEALDNKRARKQIRLTGIKRRRQVADGQRASDLATEAGSRVLQELSWEPDSIRALIFVTQSPDLDRPATAFLIQERLGIGKDCLTYDINMGCAGFIGGLITLGNILQGCRGRGLLFVGESVTPEPTAEDFNSLLEGDAGACAALEYTGNDGSRAQADDETPDCTAAAVPSIPYCHFSDSSRTHLLYKGIGGPGYMDGNAILLFGLSDVAESVKRFFADKGLTYDDVDYFVFHQAQKMIVDGVASEAGIPADKVLTSCEEYGNTSSVSIPLTLSACLAAGEEYRVFMCGFGIGLSWGMCIATIGNGCVMPVKESSVVYTDRERFPLAKW